MTSGLRHLTETCRDGMSSFEEKRRIGDKKTKQNKTMLWEKYSNSEKDSKNTGIWT